MTNFSNPSEVGRFIGGKFGFRQVQGIRHFKYHNSVKINCFIIFVSNPNYKNTVYKRIRRKLIINN